MAVNQEILNQWAERLGSIFEELRYRKIAEDKKVFAKILKKPYSNVVQALKGNDRFLTENFMREICTSPERINIDFNWLVYGKGEVMMHLINEDGSVEPIKVDGNASKDHELINLYRDYKIVSDENRVLEKEIKRLEDELADLKKSPAQPLIGTKDASGAKEDVAV